MVKKLFRYLVRTLSALLICILIYFVYISICIQTSQIICDPNGYYGVAAIINGQHADTLLFDTQASTALAKQETLDRYEAEYWSRKPMPIFNFCKQVYFSKLYKVNNILFGDFELNLLLR